jgi:membrane fusion protein, multidrug efflux system
LTYAQVTAPITGIVGLRMIDLGNIVHAADAGIVTIVQVQRIAVVFSISEDSRPQVLARLRLTQPPAR